MELHAHDKVLEPRPRVAGPPFHCWQPSPPPDLDALASNVLSTSPRQSPLPSSLESNDAAAGNGWPWPATHRDVRLPKPKPGRTRSACEPREASPCYWIRSRLTSTRRPRRRSSGTPPATRGLQPTRDPPAPQLDEGWMDCQKALRWPPATHLSLEAGAVNWRCDRNSAWTRPVFKLACFAESRPKCGPKAGRARWECPNIHKLAPSPNGGSSTGFEFPGCPCP